MFFLHRPENDPEPGGGGVAEDGRSIKPDLQERKIAQLEKKIAALEARSLAGAKGGGEDLAEDPPSPKTAVKIFGADGNTQIDLAEVTERVKQAEAERAEKRIAAQLASLSQLLNLSDEQAEKVRALLEKQQAGKKDRLSSIISFATDVDGLEGKTPAELAGQLLGGNGAGEEADAFDFDSELLAVLDDDQKSAYREYLDNRNENHIEATANRQLAQLQTTVTDMSKDQKDQAFDEFARIAREDIEANGAPAEDGGFDLGRRMQQREAEQAAMEGILTPEQFEVYRTNNARNISVIGGEPGSRVLTSEGHHQRPGGDGRSGSRRVNLLAHLHLSAGLTPEETAGNVLADFLPNDLEPPPGIASGIDLHRHIDGFTDRHPLVAEARDLISKPRRRLASIIVDVAFDYTLCQVWDDHCGHTAAAVHRGGLQHHPVWVARTRRHRDAPHQPHASEPLVRELRQPRGDRTDLPAHHAPI